MLGHVSERRLHKESFTFLVFGHAFEHFGHVIHGIEDLLGHENGLFAESGQRHGVAGAGVDLDDLLPQLIFHLEEDAGVKDGIADIIDDDAGDFRSQPDKDVLEEIVREGAFLAGALQSHAEGLADRLIDRDDEGLFLGTEEDNAPVGGGKDALDGDRDDFVVHKISLVGEGVRGQVYQVEIVPARACQSSRRIA